MTITIGKNFRGKTIHTNRMHDFFLNDAKKGEQVKWRESTGSRFDLPK